MTIRSALAALLLCLTPLSAHAGAVLSDADRADLTKAEAYFNQIVTLKARFLQVSPAGDYTEGTVFIQRPGLMRLEYDPPVPLLLVADGTFFIYYDKELDQTTHLFLNDTPAGIMLKEKLSFFDGEVTVTNVARKNGVIEISLTQTENPAEGELTLVFSNSPYEFKQWRVLDAQGEVTTVSLFEATEGVDLPPGLFRLSRTKDSGN